MENLINRIKRHEGLSLEPYQDPEGNWTIGWGHKIHEPCTPISIHDADKLLEHDVYHASDQLMTLKCCAGLDIVRREVLCELIFWVGFKGMLRFKKMRKAIQDKDYHLAALEIYNSELGKKYSSRARELAELMWAGK